MIVRMNARSEDAEGRRVAAEDWKEPEHALQRRLDRVLHERPEDEDSPEAEDDAGDRGQHVDEGGDGPAQAPGCKLCEIESDRDRERGGDHDRDRGGDHGVVNERGGPEPVGDRVPVVGRDEAEAELRDRGPGEVEDLVDDPPDYRYRDQRRESRQPLEERIPDPVPEPALCAQGSGTEGGDATCFH